MKLIATAIAAGALLGATAASAATVSFTGQGTKAPTALLSGTTTGDVVVGYDVTADAYGLLNRSALVTQTNAGLGVKGSPDSNPNQIDGSPVFSGESLTVTFDYAVDLDSFTLGAFDGNDDYTLYVNGQAVGFGTTATGGGYKGVTSFTIQANGVFLLDGLVLGNDDFTLASFSVSQVPLPAGAGLLAGALGLLALARRRKAA